MLLTLDLATVLGFSAVLAAMAALLLLTTWHAAGRPAWLAAWAGFCGLSALAFALHALRGLLPEALLIFGATPLYALAWVLFWAGARWLRGARLAWSWVLLPPALWVLACTIPAVQARLEWRALLIAGLSGSLMLLGAQEILRLRGSAGLRRAALALGLLTLLLGLGVLGRAGLILAGVPVAFSGLTILFAALLSVAIGFAGLALASIQAAELAAGRIAGMAQREAAALQAGRDEILRLHGALPALVFLREVAPDGSSRLAYRGGDLEAVTGWSAAALAPYPDIDHLSGPGTPPVSSLMQQVMREGQVTVDWRLTGPDGAPRWVRTVARRVAPRPDGGAEVVGYVLDVDAEYRAAAALAAGRAEIERLHAGLPAMVFLRAVAPDGSSRRLYRGGDIAAVTGWPAAAILQMEDLDALHGPETPSLPHALREAMRTGAWLQDWQMRRPDGSLHWMRTRIHRLSQAADGSGEVAGYVLDVEAEYRATADQRAAEAREAAALRATQAQLERLHAGLPAIIEHRDAAPDGTSRLLYRGGDVEAVTGWSADQLAGHESLDHLDGPGARSVEDLVSEVLGGFKQSSQHHG